MLAFKGYFVFSKKYGDSRDPESFAFEVQGLLSKFVLPSQYKILKNEPSNILFILPRKADFHNPLKICISH